MSFEKEEIQELKSEVKKRKVYIKPEYKLEKQMIFMFDSLKKLTTRQWCRQCSTCHGCR